MWRWRRDRSGNGGKRARIEQEALLRSAERMTPIYEKLADVIADLPAEELADRMRRAMTVRHP